MPERATTKGDASSRFPEDTNQHGDPEPDPEPPAAPPIIILSENGKAPTAPHSQPYVATSSHRSSTTTRYNSNLPKEDQSTVRGEEPDPDPVPPAPPVIILSNKRIASSSPPQPESHIQPTGCEPSPTLSISNLATATVPRTATTDSQIAPATSDSTHPLSLSPTSIYHNHTMGSKASKLAPSHGKLQPSQDRQDKAEMAEPSNYYTHRSKSMRRKAGKTGATSATGGSGGGAGGGVGGAV